MNPDPTNRHEGRDRHDPYLDAVHEVSERERGARRLRGEALDAAHEAAAAAAGSTPEARSEARPEARPGKPADDKPRRVPREDESADPVGDGRGDADYAKKLPGDLPGASRTRDDR